MECSCRHQRRRRIFFLFYFLSGLLALAWFLVRVVPKPSRAAYPCQRLAMPLASSFVLWVAGLIGSILAFRTARRYLRQARYAIAGLSAAAGIGIGIWALSLPGEQAGAAWTPSDPPNTPVGIAKGVNPGRVVWVHDPDATSWNGSSNYWWSDTNTDQAAVDRMMADGIRNLAGAATEAEAWDALFRHFNRTHDRGDAGYQAGEKIAVKINMNVTSSNTRSNAVIPSPQAVLALLRQLVRVVGAAEADIAVYDASRCIVDAVFTPSHGEFPQVRFVNNLNSGGRELPARDTTVEVHFADPGVSYRDTTRLPTCVTEATYLINMALLRGHQMAGVTLCAKNHFGSVWRPEGAGTWSPSHIHPTVGRTRAVGTVNSLVDLIGHRHLGGKTVLFMIDAIYGGVHQSASSPVRWQMSPFNRDWTSSLFLSQDGVAIDSVAVDFCRNEPALSGEVVGTGVDNYLHEAALADSPPSGATYDPEGDGTRLGSLGVHEHWNDATDKQYSRNLGTGDGIELLRISSTGGFRRGDANADNRVDLSDPVAVLLYQFRSRPLSCESSADANDSGAIDVADAVYLLGYLFASGSAPTAPFAACGPDPSADTLTCASFAPCGGVPQGTPRKILAADADALILVPADGTLGLAWIELGFNATGWTSGKASIGYDTDTTYDAHILTDVEAAMRNIRTSAYIRVPFSIAQAFAMTQLTLLVKYDDGFIAYLDGVKVAEVNAPGTPAWNSAATTTHDDAAAVSFEPFDISAQKDLLTAGDHVLAIHGLNQSASSSDFLIAVELEAIVPAR